MKTQIFVLAVSLSLASTMAIAQTQTASKPQASADQDVVTKKDIQSVQRSVNAAKTTSAKALQKLQELQDQQVRDAKLLQKNAEAAQEAARAESERRQKADADHASQVLRLEIIGGVMVLILAAGVIFALKNRKIPNVEKAPDTQNKISEAQDEEKSSDSLIDEPSDPVLEKLRKIAQDGEYRIPFILRFSAGDVGDHHCIAVFDPELNPLTQEPRVEFLDYPDQDSVLWEKRKETSHKN